MNNCPITYLKCPGKYSKEGLKRLSARLKVLEDFPYSREEQIREASDRATKMSIQGVQPKLSVRLNIANNIFEVVDKKGQYIIKPQNSSYELVPENEDVTMKMARICGIITPVHGLAYAIDNSLFYFIKRFDRKGRKGKLAVEDFAQLTGNTRDTKYNASMEKVAEVIENFCAFPMIEKIKLFKRTLFAFITGNEDMHLKNFSLITKEKKVELSPAYDQLNTSIAVKNPVEEIALPIKGKKNKLTATLLFDYFGGQVLGLNKKVLNRVILDLVQANSKWQSLLDNSFLSVNQKQKYQEMITDRFLRLGV